MSDYLAKFCFVYFLSLLFCYNLYLAIDFLNSICETPVRVIRIKQLCVGDIGKKRFTS